MNRINVSLQQSIITLVERGWSKRRIARELRLDRATVTRQLLATANTATDPAPGSGEAVPDMGRQLETAAGRDLNADTQPTGGYF